MKLVRFASVAVLVVALAAIVVTSERRASGQTAPVEPASQPSAESPATN